MDTQNLIDRISEQKWLAPVDKTLQKTADVTLNQGGKAGQKVRDWMHGIWLGHPLHPILTDLPIGAWTIAALCDCIGSLGDRKTRDKMEGCAQSLTILGLFGAAGAAITGLNDWQHTHNTPRRVGTLHAVLNISATVLYLVSLVQRRGGAQNSGKMLGLAGYGLMSAASYLGGTLVYDEKIGVTHAPLRGEWPTDWTPVLAEKELAEGAMKCVEAEGAEGQIKVLVARKNGKIYALAQECAHLGGPLSEGKMEGLSVVCPWHDSRFSLEDGSALEGPTAFAQPRFATRIHNGQIEIKSAHPVPEDVAEKQDWETV